MSSYSNICFYGGGAWGQALAITLASLGHKSTLIVSDKIRETDINNHLSKRFPQTKLSPLIKASVDKNQIIQQCDLIFITTESKRVLDVINQVALLSDKNIHVINTSKGFATSKGETFSEVVKRDFPQMTLSILSGPTFADEIANNQPAAAVIANKDIEKANSICKLFHNSNLRLYPSNDPQGVSIAGAVKNIIAIGAGIIEGLGLGDNAKAALITRGISETSELIKKAGGNYTSAFGLAGIGDMSLTCSGPHSRNMAYGMKIVNNNNEPPKELVEGLNAIHATIALSEKLDIELPIMTSIKKILNREANIDEIIKKLLSRPIKNEFS
jgi:glycerol-3-phosphate dehydrogenase (NAD(P)+)